MGESKTLKLQWSHKFSENTAVRATRGGCGDIPQPCVILSIFVDQSPRNLASLVLIRCLVIPVHDSVDKWNV